MRLRRMGRKKRPYYRIVAADSRSPRDGRFIEMIGTYDPIASPHLVNCEEERVFYWLKNGAQPSDTVRSLLRREGLWLKWTLLKQGADEAKIAQEMENWQKAQEEKSRRVVEKEKKAAEEAKKKAEEKQKEEAKAEEAEEPKKAAAPAAEAEAEAPAEEKADAASSDESKDE